MFHWLRVLRARWIGQLITLSVMAGATLIILVGQLGSTSQPAKASPMYTPAPADASPTTRLITITSAPSLPTRPRAVLHDAIEIDKPERLTRPTPTTEVVVFPAPILPPTIDGVRRTANVPILMYHYISSPPTSTDHIRVGLSVPPEVFEAQLKLLADNGFTTITLLDLYQHLAVGQPLPDKPIVLTFDDGYLDNYQNAFPLLRKYGFTGTFFVLTAPADRLDPAYLSWDMIKTMSASGMDMELHSKDHVDLRHRDYDYLVWEIIGGRQSIEAHTHRPVVFMAYPSGKYDAAVLKFLSSNNFWAAVATESGRTHTLSDKLIWTRLRIAGQLTLTGFAKLLGIQES